ncbi:MULTISPECIES: MaoC/PaaZ C-terminal domain-containing protein [unclassified Sphingomonas]|uniref:MaoC/PaaZ C-terminal domain-containing protein n=1 Tax=unclassified Sphingomonas TaxID=196159 RepID=UPI0006F359AB|nr:MULTISPECIES: MaoC/PaaZ C-terminal domain-containing protein [unclassified Sphingomonas]KQX18596.1 hypothetical protein ASD17_15750 [Sphingomonas sp. Root1294]KQY72081.1 hypothetical protein ASD39_19225 [Sphingomonas sp. Root50]KRB94650.1 hypothetical protein ASE22_01530 [Sphingomonas sp. Root720]
MALNPAALVAKPPIETLHKLSKEDVILYGLGVGASELPFLYEKGLKVLPTMAFTMATPGFFWPEPEYDVDWRRILHGESYARIHKPLPTSGNLVGRTTFGPVYDKGDKGAIVYQNREIFTENGELVASIRSGSFLRGDGGNGGTADSQPAPHPIPARPATAIIDMATAETQALIYRLSGDMNPLHADPEIAADGGFPRPILHGLCTLGVAFRAVLAELCDNEPERVKALGARFASPVYPGETIRVEIWSDGDHHGSFRASIPDRDVIVLNNGLVEFA